MSFVKTFCMLIYQEVGIYLKYYKPQITFKNSENGVESWCFEKILQWKVPFFLKMEEGYKVSCVKILIAAKLLGD